MERTIYDKLQKVLLAELREDYVRNTLNAWEQILKKNKGNGKLAVINKDLMHMDLNQVFLVPLILKPGKQNFFVFTEESERVYYSRHLTRGR